MSNNQATLWYVHDPMCSYCYAFNKVWQQVELNYVSRLTIKYLVGGLAPDSNEPMADKMQSYLIQTWHRIADNYDVKFNHNFFTNNIPRRSTYMACRAVLVAKTYNQELPMIKAIQNAYYLKAQNPADVKVLVKLAKGLAIEPDQFKQDLLSQNTENVLQANLTTARQLRVNSFPSLVLENNNRLINIAVNYLNYSEIINSINSVLPKIKT